VEEMRFVAMKLHTKEQAPKEGEAKVDQEQQKSMMQWVPTREGYLQFLAESKVMYEALETIMAEASHDSCESPHSFSCGSWPCHTICRMSYRLFRQ